MTPFGARLRALREARGIRQAELAAALHVSPAYLSALEHGHRGRPSPGLVHQVNEFFGLIWDDAEELARLARQSRPRVVLDTSGLSPEATALANRLAAEIRRLPPEAVSAIAAVLDGLPREGQRPAAPRSDKSGAALSPPRAAARPAGGRRATASAGRGSGP